MSENSEIAMMDCSMTNVLGEEEEDNVFEIIEEISDDEGEEKKEETFEESSESSSSSASLSSSNEFSLSSLKFALGDALSGSATSFGTAAEKIGTLAESLKSASLHNAPPPKMTVVDGNSSISSSNHTSKNQNQQQYARAKSFVVPSFEGRGLVIGDGGKPRKAAPVNFGKFERRARRLKYTNEDVAEIVDDPEQFEELRLALREMGAMTDTTLKLKLHWYIRNSKREKERMRQEAEQKQKLQQQLQQEQQEQQHQQQQFPETPPTELQVVDRAKVLEQCSSPNSVRGIYVPESL